MTLTDEQIRGVRGEVAGWDPVGLTRADAGSVCRGLVSLAEDVARVQVLALVEAKASGLLAGSGSRDVAGWLRAQGVAGKTARTLGDAAWSVAKSALVRGAVETAKVSVAHAAELREVVDLASDGRCDEHEVTELLEHARDEKVEVFRKTAQSVVMRVKQFDKRPTGKVYESDADHGQKQLRSFLDPDQHAKVLGAIDAIVDEHWRAGHPGSTGPDKHALPELRASALVELAERAMSGGGAKRSGAEVIVIIDAETFYSGLLRPGSICRMADGTPIHPTVAHEWANEAGIRCYTKTADGTVGLSDTIRIEPVPLNLGRTRRLASYEQRVALAVEHTGCVFCNAPLAHTQAHHHKPWDDGGPTDIGNLGPCCTHEHHLIHDHGWRPRRAPDGRWTLLPPEGAVT